MPRWSGQDELTQLVGRTFELNGLLLEAAEQIARPAGLTAAWWQVLGGVLERPLTVAAIARDMGLRRQSVQRIADLLEQRGLAEYHDNPRDRRARLLAPTDAGLAAIRALGPTQAAFATRMTSAAGGERELRAALAVADRLIAALRAEAGLRSGQPRHAVEPVAP